MAGQGTDWERKMFAANEAWATKYYDRENDWRTEDLTRAQQWRDEDIGRAEKWRQEDIYNNSMEARMADLQKAGLHPALAAGGMGGGQGIQGTQMQNTPMTSSGGRIPNQKGGQTSGSPVDAAMAFSQIQNDRAQQALMLAQARDMNASAEAQEFLNKNQETKWNKELDAMKAGTDLMKKQIEEIDNNITSSKTKDALTEKQKELIIEQIIEQKRINWNNRNKRAEPESQLGKMASDIGVAGGNVMDDIVYNVKKGIETYMTITAPMAKWIDEAIENMSKK
jgi:hypothetical protein